MIAVVGGVAYYLLAGAGKTYAVPLVNGEPVATAQAQIKAQHLRSTVVYRNSNSVKANTVINSNPAEGNNVPANTLVTLFVSKGQAPVAVPNVVGQQQDQAAATLQSKGFKVDTKTDATSSSPAGQVISQNPSGGTAAPGATITITVSGGAVSVPSVVGDSQADREPGPDHGRLPGQRAAGVGPGAVRQRHGLQPAARPTAPRRRAPRSPSSCRTGSRRARRRRTRPRPP